MATVYGDTVNSRWRAYAEYSTSETATTLTLTVTCGLQVNAYSVDYNYVAGDVSVDYDANNSATKYINKHYSAGVTYYEFCSASKTFTKGKSAQSKSFSAGVTFPAGSSSWMGSSRAYGSVTVPAISSYTVSYNANGGSGAPSSQTKWYGEALTLSGTAPSRTGHSFQGWATSASGSASYQPGGTYTANSSATLYAVWRANTYTVSYNANGGSGAPGAQTKTYGVSLTLSSTRPARTNYNFKGWGTSASSTSASYQPGGTYTANSSATLYAVWELAYLAPRVTGLTASRCTASGALADDGTYAKVSFSWATDKAVTGVKVGHRQQGAGWFDYEAVAGQSGTGGSVSVTVGPISIEYAYEVAVSVTDAMGTGDAYATVAPSKFILDFEPSGSAAFGAAARSFPAGGESVEFYNGIVSHQPHMVTVPSDTEGSSSSGYVRVISFENKSGSTYSNSSIEVTFVQRARHACRVSLFVTNQNGNALSVSSAAAFSYAATHGDDSVYVRNKAANILELWVRKSEGYDTPKVVNVYYDRFYMSGLTYSTVQELESGLSGATAVPVRSVLGVAHRKSGGYYGLSLPDGGDGDWLRTTGPGLIPYSSGGSSSLGTSGWPFNATWTNELSWNGGGLRGRVMKQIWSGTWTSGSITVSEAPNYNVFLFAFNPEITEMGIGLRYPGMSRIVVHGVNSANAQLYINLAIVTTSGQTLSLPVTLQSILGGSSLTTYAGVVGIYRIWGIL